MSFRLWVGVWVAVALLIIVAFDLSALVRYITRFTEESFAVLISIIFIFESFAKLGGVWKTHPLHTHAGVEKANYTCHCQHPTQNVTMNMTNTPEDIIKIAYGNLHLGHSFELNNWSSIVYEDCITHRERIIVRTGCIRYVT